MGLPFKQTPNPWPSNEEPTHSLHVLQVLCVRPRHLSAQLRSGERDIGPVLGQVVQPRRDRTEHGGLLLPRLWVDAALIVLDPGLSLATTPGVGAGLGPTSPKALITSRT